MADAFAVAVRRQGDLPEDDTEVLPWLIGTVRHLAANQRRRRRTREEHWRAAVRDFWHLSTVDAPDDAIADRDACIEALAALSTDDRELLLLIAWEGLTPAQAAELLGIRPNTLSARLTRARRRLRGELTTRTTEANSAFNCGPQPLRAATTTEG